MSSFFNVLPRYTSEKSRCADARPGLMGGLSGRPGPHGNRKMVCIVAERDDLLTHRAEETALQPKAPKGLFLPPPSRGSRDLPRNENQSLAPLCPAEQFPGFRLQWPLRLVAKRRSKNLFWFQFALSAPFFRKRGGGRRRGPKAGLCGRGRRRSIAPRDGDERNGTPRPR